MRKINGLLWKEAIVQRTLPASQQAARLGPLHGACELTNRSSGRADRVIDGRRAAAPRTAVRAEFRLHCRSNEPVVAICSAIDSRHTMVAATQDAADPLLYRLPEFPSVFCPTIRKLFSAAFPALVVGGEPRIPVHLLLSRVLATEAVSEVQALMDDLNIHKSIASSEQAERLRMLDVEVSSTHDCSNMNLMTRSDAERVCGILRIESDCDSGNERAVEESERLYVQHNMFGTVKGWVYPSRKGGRSVRCEKCQCFFTPEDFVAHSHNSDKEYRRTIHWGFDPSNWRLMLELVKPSSEYNINVIRWKEFIDEPIETSHSLASCETSTENSTNKFKRSLVDNCVKVPPKLPRYMNMPVLEERLVAEPAVSDSSGLPKLPFCGSLSNVLSSKTLDTLLDETVQKETGFKTKSFASISKQPSMTEVGQLLPIDCQPVAEFSDPSYFMLVYDTMLRLRSSCEKLECLEHALKQSSVDLLFTNALRDIRSSLMQCTVTEFERLQTTYDSLFSMLRQSYATPMSGSNDPLLRTEVSNLHADHVVLGATNLTSCSGARLSNDLLQQHTRLVQLDQFGVVSKSMTGAAELPLMAFISTGSQTLHHVPVQQLMQFLSMPQQTR
uniref:C-SKI_SMAD_bind domain-containing protein n=1 Tax=Angiostrongylus cantonensis TaxID=6313 RepID=A0A0K0CYK5_ANGCA